MSTYDDVFKWLPHMRFESPREYMPANLRVLALGTSGARVVEVFGRSWLVWDNGGEIGAELINVGSPVFVPTTSWGIGLDSGTIANRLVQVINGEPIDYEFRMDFDLSEVVSQMEVQP